MRFVHDETLDDLAHITASVNIPRSQASKENPMLATITIDPSTLFSILTSATLYRYDNPVKMKGDLESYRENKDWYDLQGDAIRVLEGRLSVACDPDYGHSRDKEVSQDRKFRRLFEEQKLDNPEEEIQEETMQDLRNKIARLESQLARVKSAIEG
jgi:hypothetical protein